MSSVTNKHMIVAKKLSKTFNASGTKVQAVKEVSFELKTGQLGAIIGKSGSGKSTLLALLGALDEPTEGEILVDETEVTKLHGHALLSYRRSTVGFVFQSYHLIPNLNALQNVMLPMEFSGRSKKDRQERAEHILGQVGLTGDVLQRKPGKLSGGEQQRVAIARALANSPKLVLADEPTGNLDSSTSSTIIDLLHQLARSEKTMIITVTHDQGIAAHADRVFRLHDGKLSVERSE